MEKQIEFIREILVGRIDKLQQAGFYDVSFVLLSQGVETLGAFLDGKPFKAPAQSKERFARALSELFPCSYLRVNEKNYLYAQLRSCLSHLGFPGRFLLLTNRKDAPGAHLEYKDGKIVLIAEDFFEDFKKAAQELIRRLEAGELKKKYLPLEGIV